MPVNTTVSHVSPLISYIPRSAWFEGCASDPNLEDYTNKSYHATNNTESGNASVAFSWWGTGVWVHGGYRRRLGQYTVTLDGTTTLHQGYVNGTDEDFQAVLFNASDLPAGPHHLRIMNASNDRRRPVFDIESIIFESTLEEAEAVPHTSPDCAWSPNGVWDADEQSHFTNNSLGAMELSFIVSSGIVLYGQLNYTSAPLSVTIDGQSSHPISPNTAISPLVGTPQVLFAVTNLDEGNHTIRVENNPTGNDATAQRMDIMFGKVLSAPDTGASNGNGNGNLLPPGIDSGMSQSDRNTVIFATSFGSLGFFFLCIFIWRVTLWLRRRAVREREAQLPRPFFARTDASPTSSSSSSYPYHRTHRSQNSYAHATSRPTRRGHVRGNTELLDEIDALQHSFSRMRRPSPVSITFPRTQPRRRANMNWSSKAAAFNAEIEAGDEDEDDILHIDDRPLQFAPPETYSPRLRRHPTDATASSCTMYDSMSVNIPQSPTSPDVWSPQSTRPLHGGARRSSIEKPPRTRRPLLLPAGSPIASTPSASVAPRALPLPPPPVAGFFGDQDLMPPPYRLLDMH